MSGQSGYPPLYPLPVRTSGATETTRPFLPAEKFRSKIPARKRVPGGRPIGRVPDAQHWYKSKALQEDAGKRKRHATIA
ncbi:hypothetical protein OC846_002968 [Tilletia horrida]|uniref:Uncharacterized protein n=1 Tax=Tilletia horrida TaxID=155126 RepID=A0AAN6JS66_9BASI|nr:hypothetical protein OC846_002968 [Tilletia horrida]